jgi:3-dehydroquinate synthase
MKTLNIQGRASGSRIQVGESFRNVSGYLPERTIIITDANVRRLYGREFPDCPVIEIGPGEAVKNLDTVRYIYDELIRAEADRSVFILGIGGGIVCDITGFAASTYLRGVGFGFVASTLLAQVDASVGGKNGVNFSGYKNMVGVFNQPEFVICDPEMLKTLHPEEVLCGFAEIVKHAAIADADMFAYLEENCSRALALAPDVIEKLVYDSVVIKSGIVNRDEREKGERRKLNFGHTFGHAVEKVSQIPHGQAVSIGMVVASALSVKRCGLNPESADRITTLLERLGLPTRIQVDKIRALDALKRDKKREGDEIFFVLLQEIGTSVIEGITIKELEGVIHEIGNH